MINKIIEKWDWFIYRRAFHSLKRMSKRMTGFSYLMELHLHEWNKRNPIPESVKNATEMFFRSMEDQNRN
jgi:hypothetical protein